MSSDANILVCFALREEAGVFQKSTAERRGTDVLITGIGRKNAERSVRQAMAGSRPMLVLTCGFAGGLDPGLKIGDVVFSTAELNLGETLAGLGAKRARFVCAAHIATTVAEKSELRRATGADAVEMESEAIQVVCSERGVACATVRVISDTSHEDLPLDFNLLSRPDRSLDYRKLALAVAKSPGKIPALLRLQKNSQLAAERLAEVLTKVIWPR